IKTTEHSGKRNRSHFFDDRYNGHPYKNHNENPHRDFVTEEFPSGFHYSISIELRSVRKGINHLGFNIIKQHKAYKGKHHRHYISGVDIRHFKLPSWPVFVAFEF